MATFGEIKWASLIASKPLLMTLANRGNTVHLETEINGVFVGRTPDVSINLFDLPLVLDYDSPTRASYRHWLVFSYPPDDTFRATISARLRLIWPAHKWTRHKTSGFTVRFVYDVNRVAVRVRRFTKIYAPKAPYEEVRFLSPSRPKAKKIKGTRALTAAQLSRLAWEAKPRKTSVKTESTRRSRSGFTASEGPMPNPLIVLAPQCNAAESTTVPYSESCSPTREVMHRVYSSVRTPGFRQMRSSKLPVNPYSLTMRKTNDSMGIVQRTGFGPWAGFKFSNWNHTKDLFALTPPEPVHDVLAYNKAISRIIDQASAGIQSNVALTLLEGEQLVRLIGGNATKIAKSLILLRKGKFSEAVNALTEGSVRSKGRTYGRSGRALSSQRGVASNWLALQYGWKPLLSDIDGAMRLLASRFATSPPLVEVRASATKRSFSLGKVFLSPFPNVVGKQEVLQTSTTRVGLKYASEPSLQTYLSQTGFTNAPSLAWELLPWSFVVDWFMPVGPYLETLHAWDGMVFSEGYTTQFTRQTIYAGVEFDGILTGELNFTRLLRGSYSRTWIKHDRVKLTSFPTHKFIPFKSPLSVSHALNALALLTTLFRR